MEGNLYRTLLKNESKFGANDYVRGRISGIMAVICGEEPKRGYAHFGCEDGIVLTTKCTALQYQKFSDLVEDIYPGLCEFNYVV